MTAQAEGTHYWWVTVEGIEGTTTAENLSQIDPRARALIARMEGLPIDEFDVKIRHRLR